MERIIINSLCCWLSPLPSLEPSCDLIGVLSDPVDVGVDQGDGVDDGATGRAESCSLHKIVEHGKLCLSGKVRSESKDEAVESGGGEEIIGGEEGVVILAEEQESGLLLYVVTLYQQLDGLFERYDCSIGDECERLLEEVWVLRVAERQESPYAEILDVTGEIQVVNIVPLIYSSVVDSSTVNSACEICVDIRHASVH